LYERLIEGRVRISQPIFVPGVGGGFSEALDGSQYEHFK
jgi:hypothetical protein